ncbi:hypothetical protein LQV63_22010 [Paenibacillus profundus]|uniref:Uncharacterized protein n=2 Tax=Paenibacillus TaxID=44249 RepID=A0ABS8YNQ3_9BACL|nr:hypothetical protein [Paenibacillus profundus]MCE5171960.1 hypothetical protein [Paenibacillus profundus]
MRNKVKWFLCFALLLGSLQSLFVLPVAASTEQDETAESDVSAAAAPMRPFSYADRVLTNPVA